MYIVTPVVHIHIPKKERIKAGSTHAHTHTRTRPAHAKNMYKANNSKLKCGGFKVICGTDAGDCTDWTGSDYQNERGRQRSNHFSDAYALGQRDGWKDTRTGTWPPGPSRPGGLDGIQRFVTLICVVARVVTTRISMGSVQHTPTRPEKVLYELPSSHSFYHSPVDLQTLILLLTKPLQPIPHFPLPPTTVNMKFFLTPLTLLSLLTLSAAGPAPVPVAADVVAGSLAAVKSGSEVSSSAMYCGVSLGQAWYCLDPNFPYCCNAGSGYPYICCRSPPKFGCGWTVGGPMCY